MQTVRFRFLYAYSSAARIFWSYFWLWIFKKVFGSERLLERSQKTHVRNAKRILKSILQLQGLYIKVGQMISIMTTVLPAPLTQSLEGLQDAVPPRSYEDIEKRFLEEFSKRPEEVFKSFERKALASASLGQVHVASLPNGSKVAVKVQYPEIEERVRVDLKILRRIFGLLHLIFPHYGLQQTYEEVALIVKQELDFIQEGKNLETIREHFKEEPDFIFSKVHWDYSTQRVLTLEFMEGVKISNIEKLKNLQINPSEVASKIIHAYCKQIFIDGVYHADPHPGNFLVQAIFPSPQPSPSGGEGDNKPSPLEGEGGRRAEEGSNFKIVMMDFGATARISDNMRRGSAKFIEGIIRRDNKIISQSMKDMGFIAKVENEEVFDRIVEFFYDRLKDIKLEDVKKLNLNELGKMEDLIEFKKLDVSFKDLLETFNVPKDWALLERALILLYGLTSHLDPHFNPLSIIIPYAEQFVLGGDKKLGDVVLEALKEVALSYLRLPSELHRSLRRLNQGEIELIVKSSRSSDPSLSRSLHRLNISLLCMGAAFASYLLYKEEIPFWKVPLIAAGLLGVWLLGAFLKRR